MLFLMRQVLNVFGCACLLDFCWLHRDMLNDFIHIFLILCLQLIQNANQRHLFSAGQIWIRSDPLVPSADCKEIKVVLIILLFFHGSNTVAGFQTAHQTIIPVSLKKRCFVAACILPGESCEMQIHPRLSNVKKQHLEHIQ